METLLQNEPSQLSVGNSLNASNHPDANAHSRHRPRHASALNDELGDLPAVLGCSV